jgi:hypothetical protein
MVIERPFASNIPKYLKETLNPKFGLELIMCLKDFI